MKEQGNGQLKEGRTVKGIFFFFAFLYLLSLGLLSRSPVEIEHCNGLNYIKNYNPGRHPQNWSITQDKRGILYVGNQGGVLEYDGVSWRTIEIPNNMAISLAVADNGTVYIGGFKELGCLAPDSKGKLQYKSLMGYLNGHQKKFSHVWRTNVTKEGVYFRTSKYLFRWNPDRKQIKVWETGHSFNASFTCNGRLFVHQRKSGLKQMVNDAPRLIRGDERLTNVKIYMMAPYDDSAKKLLIGTRSKGFYLYDGIKAVPFPTEVEDYLSGKELYHGIRLSCGDFALATIQGGLVIMDAQGKLKKVFTKASGLQDICVQHVFEDSRGNLWLALDNGVSKIEYASPVSVYNDNRSALPGNVLTVARHGPRKDLYAGTTRGLFSLTPASSFKFRRVTGISGTCLSILSIDDSVLTATTKGVFPVKKDIKKKELIQGISYVLHRSKKNPNRIWAGTAAGLVSLIRENGRWTKERQFKNITESISTIVEDPKGNLWLGSTVKGVIKVDFPVEGGIHPQVVTRCDTSHGLPAGAVRVYWAADQAKFATDKGLFRFDEKNKAFFPDKTLGNEFANGSRNVWRIAEDKNKNIWFHSEGKNFQGIPQPGGATTAHLHIHPGQVNAIYPDPDGNIVWFASNDGLIRYDTRVKKTHHPDIVPLIRKVVINGTHVIFNGYPLNKDRKGLFVKLTYKERNIGFDFAVPFFENENGNRYRYFLEGFNENWSGWSNVSQKDYSHLDSGTYTFRVRAKNVYEDVSRDAVFKFRILPPWYKTWWAFSVYAGVVFFLVFFIVRWRSWKLVQEKQRLEQVVRERTGEIHHKNRQLEEQSEKLKEMDKVKSRFFANISHEFRTPLTLITGPLEQMLSNCRDKETERKMKLMLRNSQRLLMLINQLLDLSRFDTGTMKLLASRQNIIPFLKGIADSFDFVAEQYEVELTFHSEEEDITLYFDAGKLEEVIFNLLINAIKFTPPGGKVTLSAAALPPDFLEISVRDTGIGIPRDQLEHIFDRFYQVETSSPGHHLKGTGIGLALTKELINLHHGRIDAHSHVGEDSGTQFIIRLPLGDKHLKPEEIATGKTPLPFKIPASAMIEKEAGKTGTIEPAAHEKDIILVVDDSADVREYIRGSLEPLYTVAEAKNGEEGIHTAKEIIPDLIISDIMMPGIDGYELCRILKDDILTSHVPVILLTAKAAEEDMLTGLETGADDYITKPFNTKILCARIKNLIDLRRQIQQNLKREMVLQPVKTAVSKIDKEFLKELQEVIEKNLSDTEFNVEQMGKKLYMSRATIYRKIHALTGETPTEYIRSYRLKRGAELLKNNFGTVLEVALEVGFSSSSYFTKCFREKFHQLPSEL